MALYAMHTSSKKLLQSCRKTVMSVEKFQNCELPRHDALLGGNSPHEIPLRYVRIFLAKNEKVVMLNYGGNYVARLFLCNDFLDFSWNVHGVFV
jgi:hypothetical protein